MRKRAFLGIALACAAGAGFACGGGGAQSDGGPTDARIEKNPPVYDAADAAPIPGPDRLSDTGLYADFASRTLAPGVMEYTPRYSLWSDGADKKRFLLLPAGQAIDTSQMDDWVFPEGTKVWKEFSVGGTVVETRMLWKKAEGWFEMGYAWLADGTDALAAPEGASSVLGTTHDVPPQEDCNECHSNVRDVVIGVSAVQLGAKDGDGTLGKLAQAGMLTTAPPSSVEVPGSGVVKDALGYLHANCGNCHNAASELRFQTHLRLRVLVGDGVPENTGAYQTAPFLIMKHVFPPDFTYTLVPGHPEESGIVLRMAYRSPSNDNPWAMPPVGTNIADVAGLQIVSDWIASMKCGSPCEIAPAPP